MKRLLASNFPLPQPLQNTRIVATAGVQPTLQQEMIPRFSTRDQTTAVTFGPQALAVETTTYSSFERFVELVRVSVDARQKVAPVDGLTRLGLRYIDEIRVPDVCNGVVGWREWVNEDLLGAAQIGSSLGLTAGQSQGVTVFDRGQNRQITFQYGSREGFAVFPGGPLQRSTPPPGPFFLLDIDSYWMAAGEVPEFIVESIISKCQDLHEPVSQLFENLITERLRKEVLRNA
jgi:uncharacterized protein (TIGR04255 family)